MSRRQLPSLADDLILEILVRLPAKSVGRFRCVSKRWLSDLTDPNFIQAHSSRSPTSGFFLFKSPYDPAGHFPFDFESRLPDPTLSFLDKNGRSPEFLDCCNGLILCDMPYRNWKREDAYDLAVCNPLTRDCHFIPVPDTVFSKDAFLAFDPSVSPHFKVVSVRGGMEGNMFIYSSDTRKWKLLTKDLRTKYNNIHFDASTFWNGNLVWNSFQGSSLCLDVRREQLKWLPLPVSGEEHRCRYRGESGGRLHFIGEPVTVTHESVTHFDIWELMAGSTEWSVLYKIDIEPIKDMYPEVNAHSDGRPYLRMAIEVVHFFRDEGGVGDRLLLSVPGKIVCYHLRDKSFTTVCDALPIYAFQVVYNWQVFYRHAHTLSPLNDNENAPASDDDWICWPSEHDKLLMDLMVENSLKGQKIKSGFRIGAWRDMAEKLNANALVNYNVSHLKSRLMSYRRDYRIVNKMLTYRGFSWDPVQQMVVAGDAEWREHLKWNCSAASFRWKRVPFKELEIICASIATSCQETKLPKVDGTEIIAKDDEGSATQVDPAIQQDDDGDGKEIQDISGAESVR